MAGLLVAVAILQYRWSVEATSAEEMRIGAELESLMMKWHGDLYGELSAICVAMQVGPDSGARDAWSDYLERYVEWNYALPRESLPNVYRNPDLVRDIYIWETNQQLQPRLFLMNIDLKRIEPSPVAPEMLPLLNRLQQNSASVSKALLAWQLPGVTPRQRSGANTVLDPGSAANNMATGWQFDAEVPAIVHPIIHHSSKRALNGQSPVDWIVITLDLAVLQKHILPELTTRYFGGMDGLDYRVGVITTGIKPRTIYSSDIGFGAGDFSASDSVMNIFGPEPGSLDTSAPSKSNRIRALRRTDWHNFLGPVWFPVIEYSLHSDPWILELQHRDGPLQVVINQVERKNLTMSALVLLLLVINIALLTIAVLRAQKFASLQMDFVASVSHELRTPLTAIVSAGENIKDGVITDKVGLIQYGVLILTQAQQLMGHVDRILLFASIRSGKDRYSLSSLNVTDILRCVRKNFSVLIQEELYVIDEYVEPDLPRVYGDSRALSSCLENLITNALKYGRNDRRIRISATLVKGANARQEVAISVEDHGMGIKNSELKSIFRPFFRSPEAIASQIHGTGLGLSLANHLAKAMGGSLSVTSELGRGSIFTLHLLVAREDAGQTPNRIIQSKDGESNEREHSFG
jgi:signal transduction histidine kinase